MLQHNIILYRKCCSIVLCIANIYFILLLLYCILLSNHVVVVSFHLYFLTSLKNLSIHSSSISGPITDLRTSRNSLKSTPRSPSPRLLLALLLFGPFGCVCVPVPVKAFLRSSRCSGLSLSAGLTPPAWSLHRLSRSVRGKLNQTLRGKVSSFPIIYPANTWSAQFYHQEELFVFLLEDYAAPKTFFS